MCINVVDDLDRRAPRIMRANGTHHIRLEVDPGRHILPPWLGEGIHHVNDACVELLAWVLARHTGIVCSLARVVLQDVRIYLFCKVGKAFSRV